MPENENASPRSPQSTGSDVVELISDYIDRDLRRYPCRFNTENE